MPSACWLTEKYCHLFSSIAFSEYTADQDPFLRTANSRPLEVPTRHSTRLSVSASLAKSKKRCHEPTAVG